jgi:hypothetical protein
MEQKKNSDRQKNTGGKNTTVITSPDGRYKKTGVAKPDDAHVEEAMDWSEEHQQ